MSLINEYAEFNKKFKKVVVLRDEQCLAVNTTGKYTYTGTDGTTVQVEKDDDTLYVSQNYGFEWLLSKLFPYLEYGSDILNVLKTAHVGTMTATALKPLDKVWKYYKEETTKGDNKRSYVIVRGILPQGKTITIDSTKHKSVFFNGNNLLEGNYTCPAYDDGSGQMVTITFEQTDYNLANNLTGTLIVNHTMLPLENMEIFVHIGTDTNLKPTIEDLLQYDTAKTFYCDGNWRWDCTQTSPITEMTVKGVLSVGSGATYNLPSLMKLMIANSCNVYANSGGSKALRYVDITHLTGNIAEGAFQSSQLKNSLIDGVETNKFIINNAGSIGTSAFNGCTNLATVNIGGTTITMENNSFSGCSNLRTVTVPVGYNGANNQFKQANISDAAMSAIIANCADRTGSTVGYWYVSSTALANMSATTLAAATAKNWQIRT